MISFSLVVNIKPVKHGKIMAIWIHMVAQNIWMNLECSAGLLMGQCGNRNLGNLALYGHKKINAALNIIILYSEEMGIGNHMVLGDGFLSVIWSWF